MINSSKDPFPFDQGDTQNGSGLHFNDMTTPGSRNANGSFSHLAFDNITWTPGDSTTTVDISFSRFASAINTNTTWQDREKAVLSPKSGIM